VLSPGPPMATLQDKVLFITGASRGIGLAIAVRAAKDGARIAIAAKTSEPHPKLPGTIHTAAQDIERVGGQALPLTVDIRHEDQVAEAVEATVRKWGGIDICINNASAISLTDTESTPMKRFDLMHQVNTRGTFATTQACLPHLKKSKNAHVLNLSPPLNMKAHWFSGHVAYTMAKYGMSMCVLGMAEEFKPLGIAVNALWPRTAIATAAMDMIGGGPDVRRQCRTVDIMADAAHAVLVKDAKSCTGNFFVDDEVLRAEGLTDLSRYAIDPTAELLPDFFLD
jgi:citronellol/citronellal dehydrogenase